MGTKALVMFHILKGVCVTQVHTFLKIGKCTLNFTVRYLPQEKKKWGEQWWQLEWEKGGYYGHEKQTE